MRGLVALCSLSIAMAGFCRTGTIELKLCRVLDGYANPSVGDCSGVKVLQPTRRGVAGAVQSDIFESCAYYRPIAMLQVRNCSTVESADIGSLLGNDWFVEMETCGRSARRALMCSGSCRVGFTRKLLPEETVCLLVGRLGPEDEYRFRLGYAIRKNDNALKFRDRPENGGFVYSNWLQPVCESATAAVPGSRDEAPAVSVHRLENNILDADCGSVKCFVGGVGTRFVDLTVVLENKNPFPIRFAGFAGGALRVEAYDKEFNMACRETLSGSCTGASPSVLQLNPGECLAVPVALDIGIEKYRCLHCVKVAYDSKGRRREALLRFDAQRRDRIVVDAPESDSCAEGVDVEI